MLTPSAFGLVRCECEEVGRQQLSPREAQKIGVGVV
jgi:hypothetical protein